MQIQLANAFESSGQVGFCFYVVRKESHEHNFLLFETSSSCEPLTFGCNHGQGPQATCSKAASGENGNERAWRWGRPVFISVTQSQTQQKAWKIKPGGRTLELLEAHRSGGTTVRRQTSVLQGQRVAPQPPLRERSCRWKHGPAPRWQLCMWASERTARLEGRGPQGESSEEVQGVECNGWNGEPHIERKKQLWEQSTN